MLASLLAQRFPESRLCALMVVALWFTAHTTQYFNLDGCKQEALYRTLEKGCRMSWGMQGYTDANTDRSRMQTQPHPSQPGGPRGAVDFSQDECPSAFDVETVVKFIKSLSGFACCIIGTQGLFKDPSACSGCPRTSSTLGSHGCLCAGFQNSNLHEEQYQE